MGIKEKIAYSIERTGNPLAPIIIQSAHTAVEKLGALMTNEADKKTVEQYCEKIASVLSIDDEVLNQIGGDPSFIMALSAILASSIEFYIKAEAKVLQ